MSRDERPEQAIARLASGCKVAVAESCTGGALVARLVSVPGSSGYFLGGVVAYADEVKRSLLGVPEELLLKHGAVSEECALAMARSVARLLGAGVAVSTTGIAGPGGARPRKPVGLTYVALVSPQGEVCTCNVWRGDRQEIIERSVEEGLRLLLEHLET